MGSNEDTASPLLNGNQELKAALEELEEWKLKHEKADTEKSRLILEKLDTEENKKRAEREALDLLKQQDLNTHAFNNKKKTMEEGLLDIQKKNDALKQKLKDYEEQLQLKKNEQASLQQQHKIIAEIPEKKVKFTKTRNSEDSEDSEDSVNIEGQFTIIQRPSITLKGGQALITFEEEKVAQRILKIPKCTVTFDNAKMDVKPFNVMMDPSVKFEVHFSVSKKTVKFSNAPPVLSDERMRDRLEMSFSKPSLGGGEVESVEYNKESGTGLVTFLNTGVAERLTLKKKYPVDTGHPCREIRVSPDFQYQMRKFQTFCGVSKRTVLLAGIEDALDEEDLQDNLEIHFQKPSNYGGEVESIRYISKTTGSAEAYFNEDTVEAE
ncbi:N-myc-interactor isoform X2 [Amia ocellicauda]|uniref:N-myc-interactor isoform X2 n=1 Tax=Amia ocellicauda TaxID=2972642 RepID=UPI0034647DE5